MAAFIRIKGKTAYIGEMLYLYKDNYIYLIIDKVKPKYIKHSKGHIWSKTQWQNTILRHRKIT